MITAIEFKWVQQYPSSIQGAGNCRRRGFVNSPLVNTGSPSQKTLLKGCSKHAENPVLHFGLVKDMPSNTLLDTPVQVIVNANF